MEPTTAHTLVEKLRETYNSGVTEPKSWREHQLKQLKQMIEVEEDKILEALNKDLKKSKMEAYLSEVNSTLNEVKEALHNLSSWMGSTSVSTPLFQVKGMSTSHIVPTSLGVVLVISPWNYPFNLAIAPLVGAIAGGNCAVVKPSELSVNTCKLLAELLPKYLDNNCFAVYEGAVEETTLLLKEKFDHIFFTGNTTVGRVIMRAAAEHLTPVTLELGGKNPCFVDSDVDLDVAARRIVWAKTYNSGQTCLAVDYVLVKHSMYDKLINTMKEVLQEFYGNDPKNSEDFGRIITKRHTQRLSAILKEINPEDVVVGGQSAVDEENCYIPPTIVKNVALSQNSPLMREELFGPILPVISVDDSDTLFDGPIKYIGGQPHPLTLYVFTKSDKVKNSIIKKTKSGSVVVNDALVHFVQSTLPFGGVGESGMGSYHGKKSFETFTHARSVLDKTTWFDLSFRYPPYSSSKLSQAKKLM